ncbi:DUF2272 domain-containing protein [Shimia sp.]|uniref:DUF2272 domain-containing protein n=1 Tax=Shimia sp. TaxID=1954381 RepID=UPI003B8AD03D
MAFEPWQVTRQEKSSLGGLQDACLDTGGQFSSSPDPNNPGKYIAYCTYEVPDTLGAAKNVSLPAVLNAMNVPIEVTSRDLQALQAVAASEVGHFQKYGATQFEGGLAAVVDTVFNRVAHKGYPRTIEAVINQKRQFSAINKLAGWHELPTPKTAVAQFVESHVKNRAAGQASAIKGATHFLNPYLSSSTAMANWGRHVKANPTAVWGNDAAKDVHYHGFPPHGTLPVPYMIQFESERFHFDAVGAQEAKPSVEMPTDTTTLAQHIARICKEELAFFKNGSAKESEDPQYLRVGDYWAVVDKSYTGRTVLIDEDGNDYNPAWSAVFVSYVLHSAGANNFPAKMAHARYFQRFVQLSNSNLYRAVAQKDETPQVGDIVHYGRQYAKRFDFLTAQARYGEDGSYPSHSDIVVSVDLAAKKITTIGGNVSNSVKAKTVQLDADNKLVDRRENGKSYPWIGILRLVK